MDPVSTAIGGRTGDDVVELHRFPGLQLRLDTPKGRGVYATCLIRAGTTIDTCPVLILSPQENSEHVQKTSLYDYTYNWPLTDPRCGTQTTAQALILGLGSMFNHSRRGQNVGWKRDPQRQLVLYWALKDVAPGEELCISYGDRLTFVDVEAGMIDDGDHDEQQRPEDVLGRIDVL